MRPALYQALAKDAGPAFAIGRDGCATLPKQSLKACFDKNGVHFSSARAPELALHLAAYGRSNHLASVNPVAPVIGAHRANYAHDNVTEWWRVLPIGFEQGFTLIKRPAGHDRLMLALAANHHASDGKDGALAWGKLRYGKLVVTDANGKIVPATLKRSGHRILIAVNDSHAVYPLTVDPLVWIEQKVTGNDSAAGDSFGISVALDGTTALVGAYGNNGGQGAAYVFTESGGTWSQTQKLTDSDGVAGGSFGRSVALDGSTALIGAYFATVNGNAGQGAAYVFTESGGTWSQTQKLTAGDGAAYDDFGFSVALNGMTALVGAPQCVSNCVGSGKAGKAYVFSESNGTWTQAAELTANDGMQGDDFGFSVALDDNSALVGAPQCGSGPMYCNGSGRAYVFGQSNGSWTQMAELTPNGGSADDAFGSSVALQGTTALIGEPRCVSGDCNGPGRAYVFVESNGSWTQMAELTANDGVEGDEFGSSVALESASALVGAPQLTGGADAGKAYAFSESNGNWTQSAELAASDGATGNEFGASVALSGATAFAGAPCSNPDPGTQECGPGAAYFYGQSDLGLAMSVPAQVSLGSNFVSQTIATNNASAVSPAVAVTVTVPAAASFVSANATQGSCSEAAGVVSCAFGPINGNAGTATANVTLKVPGGNAVTFENTASVKYATPPLTASAATTITSNSSPAASNGTLTTNENTAANSILMATAPNLDPLTFSIVGKPSHGTVTINDANTGAYTYTPDHNYSGSDSFTFKATDTVTGLVSNTAKISITVKATGGGSSGGGGGSTGWPTLFTLLGLVLIGVCLKGKRG
ncbi:MAG: Ig-like domain-containing protein [Gammaproteobacteria bacterium]